jgi:hypothetical protein
MLVERASRLLWVDIITHRRRKKVLLLLLRSYDLSGPQELVIIRVFVLLSVPERLFSWGFRVDWAQKVRGRGELSLSIVFVWWGSLLFNYCGSFRGLLTLLKQLLEVVLLVDSVLLGTFNWVGLKSCLERPGASEDDGLGGGLSGVETWLKLALVGYFLVWDVVATYTWRWAFLNWILKGPLFDLVIQRHLCMRFRLLARIRALKTIMVDSWVVFGP